MAKHPEHVLDTIPGLVEAQNAAALVELEEHFDKKVRKAVRRALHQLRSRGVEIPDRTPTESWEATEGLDELRGRVDAAAIVDISRNPGATEFVLVDVHEARGSLLCVAILSPDDRVLACEVYGQTDGQRNRMMQSWERNNLTRRLPAEWVKSRLLWARQATLARGVSVPKGLDQMVSRLGETPNERPATFLAEGLAAPGSEEIAAEAGLLHAQSHRWPILFPMEAVLQKVGEEYTALAGDQSEGEGEDPKPSDISDDDRLAALKRAGEGDAAFGTALAGPIANALDDGGVAAWLSEQDAVAKALTVVASQLRTADDPTTHPWAPHILRFQVSVAAMQMAQRQAGQAAEG